MSETSPTLRSAVAKLVRRELAKLGILVTYEYRVVQQDGRYVDLQAVRKAAGMPDLSRVVARPGAAGYAPTYQLGSTVLVAFIEGDPARPFIAFGPEVEDMPSPSMPTKVEIKAADEINLGRADGVVVREGDTISITPGNAGGPVTGIVSITLGQGVPPAVSKVRA